MLRSGVLALSYVLPSILGVHALFFWGRGIVAQETMTFILNYLADRPWTALVFDPRRNDWGQHQARELSYLVDLIDARFFATLLDHGVLLFVPLSGALGLVAIAGIYLLGASRVLGLPGVTARLLLALFLSCIVTQASTAMLYRSAKLVLSVAMLAFFFQAWRSLRESAAPRAREWPRFALLFLLGVTMTLCDRQGFFYLAMATVLVACLPFRVGIGSARGRLVIAACLGALAVAFAYNHVVGPALIHRINGYWPDFRFQQLDWSGLLSAELFAQAGRMLLAETRYFFGNLSLLATLAAGLAVHLACRRSRAGGGRFGGLGIAPAALVQVLLVLGLNVLLLALMILRHPPLYTILDHWLRYYALSLDVAFLLGCTAFAVSLVPCGSGAALAGHALILVMIVNNTLHYGEQRESMVNSPWLSVQHALSASIGDGFRVERSGSRAGSDPWLRATPEGGVVALPLGDDSFVESVRAARATLRERGPWASSGGPHWPNLRRFLAQSGSPLGETELVPELLEGLRRVGIRHVRVRPARYASPEAAQATIDAIRRSTVQVRAETELADGPDFELLDWQPPPGEKRVFRLIDRTALRVTASHSPGRVPFLVDGDRRTRWVMLSKGPEAIPAWIRVELDRPRDVARVRLELAQASFGDYPRELRIESESADERRVVYEGSVLPALVQALLLESQKAVIELDLEPNRSTALVIRHLPSQGQASWAVNELHLCEREVP